MVSSTLLTVTALQRCDWQSSTTYCSPLHQGNISLSVPLLSFRFIYLVVFGKWCYSSLVSLSGASKSLTHHVNYFNVTNAHFKSFILSLS